MIWTIRSGNENCRSKYVDSLFHFFPFHWPRLINVPSFHLLVKVFVVYATWTHFLGSFDPDQLYDETLSFILFQLPLRFKKWTIHKKEYWFPCALSSHWANFGEVVPKWDTVFLIFGFISIVSTLFVEKTTSREELSGIWPSGVNRRKNFSL